MNNERFLFFKKQLYQNNFFSTIREEKFAAGQKVKNMVCTIFHTIELKNILRIKIYG